MGGDFLKALRVWVRSHCQLSAFNHEQTWRPHHSSGPVRLQLFSAVFAGRNSWPESPQFWDFKNQNHQKISRLTDDFCCPPHHWSSEHSEGECLPADLEGIKYFVHFRAWQWSILLDILSMQIWWLSAEWICKQPYIHVVMKSAFELLQSLLIFCFCQSECLAFAVVFLIPCVPTEMGHWDERALLWCSTAIPYIQR